MNKTFETKAKFLIMNQKKEESEVYELAKKFDVTKEEVKKFLEDLRKEKALAEARKKPKIIYNTLDKIFVEKYPDIVTYTRGDNVSFYQYENGVYNEVKQNKMENLVDWLMDELSLLEERANRTKVKNTVQRIGSVLARTPGKNFVSDIKSDDEQEYLLNLKNGLLNMSTFELKEHTPEHFSTVQIPYKYDPDFVDIPKMDAFIELVTHGDTTTATMIQDMFGYCIGDGNPLHKVFYLYGPTARNGKSTTAKLLCSLIGEGNFSNLSLEILSKPTSTYLNNIVGKQINFSDETTANYMDSSSLTTMSAEGTIELNPKFKPSFSYTVKSKFLVCCNDLPKFKNGQGMKHRMIPILFEYHIPPQDRIANFEEKLLAEEGPGILNWAIEGAKNLKKRGGFLLNEKSEDALMENTATNNSVYAYYMENYTDLEEGQEKRCFSKAGTNDGIYRQYEDWCNDRNINKPYGYNNFCTETEKYARETKAFDYISNRQNSSGNTIKGRYRSF